MDDNKDLNDNFEDDDLEELDFDAYDDGIDIPSGDRMIESIESNIDHMLEVASVEAVYGQPIKQRDVLIIPAAEVSAYLGFGMGVSSGITDEETGKGSGEGGGGGGGGFSLSRPVAVIISGPNGVRVEPVVDATKIAVAGITAGVFILGMLARINRLRRSFKAVEKDLMR